MTTESTTRARRALATAAMAATALVGGVAVSGCAAGGDEVALSEVTAAAQAPADGAELDPAAFAAAMQREGTVVLDVRTPQEFADGHLPGAVNLNVESPTFAGDLATLDPTVPYAVYCRSGNRSGVALQLMQQAGFTGTYHLGGGITAWQDAGGDVVVP